MRCPKCQYQRTPSDHHVIEGVCPKCGIAYHKYQPPKPSATSPQKLQTDDLESSASDDTQAGFKERLKETLLYVPETQDSTLFWPKAILAGLFALWGGYFIIGGVDWEHIGSSFLHNVNLPFHEFGHVLFSPFGRFISILGGSLFQILMPLIVMLTFSLKYRDNYAAAIMLWWCGQNFIDVSPYIKDAEYRAIPLIRGLGEEHHDWGNLLTMTNSIESASTIANVSFLIGSGLIILSLIWAAVLLKKMKGLIEEEQF